MDEEEVVEWFGRRSGSMARREREGGGEGESVGGLGKAEGSEEEMCDVVVVVGVEVERGERHQSTAGEEGVSESRAEGEVSLLQSDHGAVLLLLLPSMSPSLLLSSCKSR